MKLVPAKPLAQSIPRGGMAMRDLLHLGAQAAEALASTHAEGILHGALDPEHLVIGPDTGIEVLSAAAASTEDYLSPEQTEGRHPDERSDIFSLGAILYHMATGRKPFRGTLRDDPVPPEEIRPDLPPEIARVINRCLRQDPERRFQHMADLKVSLEELREEWDAGTLRALPGTQRPPWQWIALGVAVAAIGVAVWQFWRPAVGLNQVLPPWALTSYTGDEQSPAFSPDGAHVIFSWNGEKQDNFDIYVKPAGPGLPQRLTTSPAPDRTPRWSPDGKWIAFIRELEYGWNDLMIVPAIGGTARKLAEFHAGGNLEQLTPAWTPDSLALILSAPKAMGHHRALYRVSLQTGLMRQISNPPTGVSDWQPAYSPDGKTLAFIRGGTIELTAVTPGFEPHGQLRTLPGYGGIRSLAWTEDGHNLVFAAGEGINSRLYQVRADGGGNPTMLPIPGMGAAAPAFAPRSHRLMYELRLQDTNIWRTALDDQSIPERVIATSVRELFPQFAPNGSRISYQSNHTGSIQIWTAAPDGSRPTQLTHMNGLNTVGARWSPDGQRLCFDSDATGQPQIYTIAEDGTGLQQLTNDRYVNREASWSLDGQWIYFSSSRSGSMEVWKMPSKGGTPIQITQGGGEAPVESDDGVYIYFTKGDGAGGLWRTLVQGGAASQVLPSIYRSNYVVTARGIYFTPPPGPEGSSIQLLDLTTGKITELAQIEKPVDLGLAISPDGLYILNTQVDYQSSDLMMIENFR